MGPQKRNPYEDLEFPPAGFKGYSLQKTFKVRNPESTQNKFSDY